MAFNLHAPSMGPEGKSGANSGSRRNDLAAVDVRRSIGIFGVALVEQQPGDDP